MDRFLRSDTVLRVLALVLACAIWLGVNAPGGGQPATGGLSQPFSYLIKVQAPEGMVATRVAPSFANVVVDGDPSNMAAMQSKMAHVTVLADATGLSVGSHVVKLQVKNMPFIAHTVNPQTVTVVLKALQTIRVPLHVQVVGNTKSGYVYGTPQFADQTATVSGSTYGTNRVASVSAQVSVSGKMSTFTQNVSLLPEDVHGNRVSGVTVTPASIAVTVPVESPKTTTPVVAQVEGVPAPGYAVSGLVVNPSTVTVYGTLAVASAGPSKTPVTTVPVDVSGMRSTSTLRITIPMNPGITRVEPDYVKATVTIEPSETRTLSAVPIRIINGPRGETVKINGSDTVTVAVSGPKSMIDTLTISDVAAYIDASHVTPHHQSATLTVEVPQWIRVTQLSRSTLPLSVTAP